MDVELFAVLGTWKAKLHGCTVLSAGLLAVAVVLVFERNQLAEGAQHRSGAGGGYRRQRAQQRGLGLVVVVVHAPARHSGFVLHIRLPEFLRVYSLMSNRACEDQQI